MRVSRLKRISEGVYACRDMTMTYDKASGAVTLKYEDGRVHTLANKAANVSEAKRFAMCPIERGATVSRESTVWQLLEGGGND